MNSHQSSYWFALPPAPFEELLKCFFTVWPKKQWRNCLCSFKNFLRTKHWENTDGGKQRLKKETEKGESKILNTAWKWDTIHFMFNMIHKHAVSSECEEVCEWQTFQLYPNPLNHCCLSLKKLPLACRVHSLHLLRCFYRKRMHVAFCKACASIWKLKGYNHE